MPQPKEFTGPIPNYPEITNAIEATILSQRIAMRDYMAATRQELFSISKQDHVVLARRMTWLAMYEHYKIDGESIARDFQRDHSTIYCGLGRLRKQIQQHDFIKRFAEETFTNLEAMG